jgi:hypothetical protein
MILFSSILAPYLSKIYFQKILFSHSKQAKLTTEKTLPNDLVLAQKWVYEALNLELIDVEPEPVYKGDLSAN